MLGRTLNVGGGGFQTPPSQFRLNSEKHAEYSVKMLGHELSYLSTCQQNFLN